MANENRVNLRFSDEEIQLLKSKIGDQKLTTFCKEIVIRESANLKIKPKPSTKYKNYPPELLGAINKIGNNLNQVARQIHIAKKTSSLETGAVLIELTEIKKQLNQILDIYVD